MSPLGKYAEAGAFLISLGVIAAAIVAHMLGSPSTFLDNMALIAIGAVFGRASSGPVVEQAAKTNGQVQALHKRMDAAGVPPSTAPPAPPQPLEVTGLHGGPVRTTDDS